jgi:predicted nucleic acid-binding protein
MVRALFDTNIVIDYLNGERKALDEMCLYNESYISIITYTEVLVGIKEHTHFDRAKDYLLSFNVVYIDQDISDLAIQARKKYKLKIADALILASAQKINAILVTRDINDFNLSIPIVREPYKL